MISKKGLRQHSIRAGMSPGTLIHIGDNKPSTIQVSLMDYSPTHLIEKENISIEECVQFLHEPPMTWINVRGVHDKRIVEALGKYFGFHDLVMEDVMNTGQLAKLDDYKDYLFMVLRTLCYKKESDRIEDEQVSIILGKNFVVSFLENSHDIFASVRERIRKGNPRIRSMGSGYLCYALIDSIVDQYFVILEHVNNQLEDLESALIHDPKPATMQQIQKLKREIILLRKSVWPMREAVNNLRRIDSDLIKPATQVYLHDVYDHTVQVIETIESFRDISAGLLEIYLSTISQRMNEIMKVLTVVATIFVPLTFIASVYGMNFEHIPELHWRYGYPMVLLLMFTVGCGMVYYFWRKRWL